MNTQTFTLTEKVERGQTPRIINVKYHPKTAKDEAYTDITFKRGEEPEHYLGTEIEETKRGWTVETTQFNGSSVLIFYPRNRYSTSQKETVEAKKEDPVDPKQTKIE